MTLRDDIKQSIEEESFEYKAREALKEIRLVCRLECMHAEEAGGLHEDGPEHIKRSLSLNRWITRKCADVLMTKG